MSVNINWTFTNYTDVGSILICRSEVLNSEKAFEDSLNGVTETNFPDIIGLFFPNDLTEGSQSFTDTETLSPNTTYYYCVAAGGLGSNGLFKVGPSSSEASTTQVTNSGDGSSSVAKVTTAADSGSDTTAPQPPTGLLAAGGDTVVNLSWSANSETDLAGYRVYRSTTSGSSYSELTSSLLTLTSYTDSTAVNGVNYFYVVTAQDTAGNESAYSSEASATPQTSGTGSGAGSDPNYLVGFAFADLLGSYKTLYGPMPPTETSESFPGINFYNNVFDTDLNLVTSYASSESILLSYIEAQLTTNLYFNTYGAPIGDLDLFAVAGGNLDEAYQRRKDFVNRHYVKKYGVNATTTQRQQGAQRLWAHYTDGMTENEAIAYFLYNLGTDTSDSYIAYAPASSAMAEYRDTANDIGVEANAPWSDPSP